ncbi:MAG: hypothetical protein H6718_27650 [Polyangiaceae bacterium]|nr:hypothetical protein [Polyangiaceae bacterium]
MHRTIRGALGSWGAVSLLTLCVACGSQDSTTADDSSGGTSGSAGAGMGGNAGAAAGTSSAETGGASGSGGTASSGNGGTGASGGTASGGTGGASTGGTTGVGGGSAGISSGGVGGTHDAGGSSAVGGTGGTAGGAGGTAGATGGTAGATGGVGGTAGAAPLADEIQLRLTNPGGSTLLNEITQFRQLKNGDLLIAGRGNGSPNQPGVLIRLSPSLKVLWARAWQNETRQQFTDVLELDDGDLVASGYYYASLFEPYPLVMRLGGDGIPKWEQHGTGEGKALALALGPSGTLFIAGTRGKEVTPSGTVMELALDGSTIRSLGFDPGIEREVKWIHRGPGNDMLVVDDSGRVIQLTSAGTFRTGWRMTEQPIQLQFAPDGTIAFVEDGGYYSEFDIQTGVLKRRYLSVPTGRIDLDRVSFLGSHPIGVQDGSSFTTVIGDVRNSSSWNLIFKSGGGYAHCLESADGALYCVTTRSAYRLADPSLPATCERGTLPHGFVSTTPATVHGAGAGSNISGGNVYEAVTITAHSDLTVDQLDVCPP